MDLFGAKSKKKIVELENALKECSEKLIEKQEHINKTNAYWKKKMREKTTSKKNL